MSELEAIPSDVQSAIEAGKRIGACDPKDINGVPVVFVPDDMRVETFESLNDHPQRLIQSVKTDTVDSFVNYFNKFRIDGISTIFCDTNSGVFLGVIDYHASAVLPAWCDHTVTLNLKQTREWQSWEKNDGMKMDQVDFAFFLEQNIDEIVSPDPATMLEIALTLKAKTKTTFESGHRLQNGQIQFQYREEIDGSAGIKGNIEIPETMKLGIQIYEGGSAYELEARFRYRIREGKVAMWYDLVRPHKVQRAAVNDVFEQIQQQADAALIIHGHP